MASIERDVQDRFFEIITEQKKNNTNNAFKVYQKLVYFRFEEIMQNTFPQFCERISSKKLEETIYEFMKNPPSTEFVWKIADDYRKFVKKNKFFDKKKYLYELLYFDWIEVEIYMREYKDRKASTFSWNKSFKLAQSSRVKKCKYDIVNGNYEQKRENFLAIYYDFDTHDILMREINEFIFILIKKINKKNSLEKILKKICKENEIVLDEAKAILEEPLKELISKKVLL